MKMGSTTKKLAVALALWCGAAGSWGYSITSAAANSNSVNELWQDWANQILDCGAAPVRTQSSKHTFSVSADAGCALTDRALAATNLPASSQIDLAWILVLPGLANSASDANKNIWALLHDSITQQLTFLQFAALPAAPIVEPSESQTSVPEPSTVSLLIGGVLGLASMRRFSRR